MAGLDSYVKLYSDFNSAIQDDYAGKTLTGNGSASINTTVKKLGAGSLELSSATSDYVSTPDHADFNLGSGNFCFDFWVRFKTLPSAGNSMCFFTQWGVLTRSVNCRITNTSGRYYFNFDYSTSGTDGYNTSSFYPFVTDTWYHLAIDRNDDYLTLFVDGKVLVSTQHVGRTIYNSSDSFLIGVQSGGSFYLNGYIDSFRFSKGISRYEHTAFTPPTSNNTATTEDVILAHMDGSDESTTFTDSSTTNPKTITVNGNAKLKTSVGFTPKIGTGSAKCVETTSYMTIPGSSDFNFGTGDYTIECWILIENLTQRIGIWEMYNGSAGHFIRFNLNGNKEIIVQHGATTVVTSSNNAINDSNWHHVAIVSNSGTVDIYVDGTSVGSSSTGLSAGNSTSTIYISAEWNGDLADFNLNGYIDEFRVSDNARYTTSFTPSTTAFSNDGNTKLLLHLDSDFSDSSSSAHTVTNGGSISIANSFTINPKCGTAMGNFNSIGDYLSISDNSDFALSSNDFLLESWIYPTSINAINFIWGQRVGSFSSRSVWVYFTSTTVYVQNDLTDLTLTYTINADEWTHIAVFRISDKIFLAINGIILKVDYITGSMTDSTAEFRIGQASESTSYRLNGYMDEFRMTNTSSQYDLVSFTPPTEEYNSGDTDAPIITALDPESGDQQIALTKTLEITFDENVIAQAGKNITIYDQGANIFEQIDVTNAKVTVTDNVVTINPAGIFEYGTLYYVLLDAGAFQDASGNPTSAITSPAYWNFLTKINDFSDAVIEIGGVDYTNQADLKSCRIVKQDNFDNQATVNIVMNTNAIKMGMEMKIRDTVTSEILFGGLIRDPQKVLLNPDFMVLKITADGYKQILGRRTFSVDVQNDLAGNTISQIFDDYLVTGGTYTDEGLSEGNIDNGATIENYVTIAKSGLKIFNDFANASGYKWWITDDKDFYFQASPTYIDNTTTKKLTPDKTDSAYIRCVDMPIFNEDSSQFRTRQFVVGKTKDDTTILGSYTDSTAETEMASRYGSGVYGSVMTSRDISTTAEANTLAETEVKTYVNPASITFKTFDKIEPLELIKVDISLLGISNETYKITKVTKTIQPDFKILSDIVAEKYVVSTKTKRNWTDDFDEMIKNNSADEDEKEIKYDEIVGGTSITNVAPDTRTLSMTVDTDKALHCHYAIVGTCAIATTITVTIAIDAVTKKVFTWDEPIGNFSKTLAFPIRTITTSKSGASITAVTSTTQTLTIAGTDLTFWASLS